MNGLTRINYIINKNNIPFLIEINSAPGISKESIIPQMIKEAHLKNFQSSNSTDPT